MAERRQKPISDITQPQKNRHIYYRPVPRYIKKSVLALGLVVVLSVIASWMWLQSDMRTVNTTTYQAVTLINNQIYFGKITQSTDSFLKLEDVYYVAQKTGGDTDQKTANQALLQRLSASIHGPEDTMYIKRNQIIYWENLKKDSAVLRTITSR